MLVEEPLLPFPEGDHWTYPIGVKPPGDNYEDNWSKRSHLLVSMNPEITKQFTDTYEDNPYFKKKYPIEIPHPARVLTPSQFQQGKSNLLYFIGANWNTHLCVLTSQVNFVL
jgi:hypothetical protein